MGRGGREDGGEMSRPLAALSLMRRPGPRNIDGTRASRAACVYVHCVCFLASEGEREKWAELRQRGLRWSDREERKRRGEGDEELRNSTGRRNRVREERWRCHMASLQERRAKMIDRGRGDLVRIRPCGWPLQRTSHSSYPLRAGWIVHNQNKQERNIENTFDLCLIQRSWHCFVPVFSLLTHLLCAGDIFLQLLHLLSLFLAHHFSHFLLSLFKGANPKASFPIIEES